MNHLYRIAALLILTLQAIGATPPQSVDLDLSQTARAFRLQFAEGTTPLLRGNVKNAGSAYTVTGWTATLYLSATWDDTSVIAIPSTTTGATYFDFQMTGTHTSTNGVFTANIIATDGTATVEWQRGEVEIRPSPGSAGAGTITLSTPLSWSGYTYSNTGSGGPYRAGSNVVFTINGDGSANINASVTGGVDAGDKGDITVSSGGTWTIDSGAVTASKLANTAVAAGSYGPITATVDAQGRLTAASTSSSAAIQSALGAVYFPFSGGTVTGSTTFTEEVFLPASTTVGGESVMTPSNGGGGSEFDADKLDGQHGTYYTDPDNLTGGTVPDVVTASKYRQPVIAWTYRDLTWNTTAGAGWTGYEIETGSSPTKRTFGLDAISAAATTDQTGTFKTDWIPVPANFAAFKTTGAIKVTWVSSQAVVGESELRGIRLIGSSDLTGANATDLYTDATVRDITTTGVPVAVSVNRSAFASTTVPAYLCVQIDASVEDGDKLAIVSIEVLSE